MIHRQNWLDTRAWLSHIQRVYGRHEKTINKYRAYMRHLIEWADNTPLPQARIIDPTFPAYLLTARNDGKSGRLGYTTVYKTLATARLYFSYASRTWSRYEKITDSWIELLQPHPECKPSPNIDRREYYTIEELRAIVAVSVETLHEARAQAAACLLYLSGMRADTFVSLPRHCVDLPNLRIYQIPAMGPRTKNNKAAITYLLDIPELLAVVRDWDDRLHRLGFGDSALWFANLNHDSTQLREVTHAIDGRGTVLGDDIMRICSRAGIEYHSPHKFRHGHIVYARSHAHTIEEAKAISQNVMHANSIITDQIYSGLTSNHVQSIITSLGKRNNPPPFCDLQNRGGQSEGTSPKTRSPLGYPNCSNCSNRRT